MRRLRTCTVAALRGALDSWLAQRVDWGAVPEDQMKREMWPGGEQPGTRIEAKAVRYGWAESSTVRLFARPMTRDSVE